MKQFNNNKMIVSNVSVSENMKGDCMKKQAHIRPSSILDDKPKFKWGQDFYRLRPIQPRDCCGKKKPSLQMSPLPWGMKS